MATTRKTTKTTKTDTKVKKDWGSIVVKVILLLGLLIVGATLGTISYRHGFHVALDHGQERLTAILLPGGVDGGLLVSAAAMIAPRTRAATRAMARLAFLVCLVTTVAMNALAAGTGASVISMAISGIPGVLFVLVIETALRLIRDMTRKTTERDTLGPVAKLLIVIKASRARAKRRQREADKRRTATPKPVPTEVKAATRYVKAATERATQAA